MTFLIRLWNLMRGYGFDWIETPGTLGGGHIMPRPGTCPYPLINDWSVKACNKAGLCGCNEGRAR